MGFSLANRLRALLKRVAGKLAMGHVKQTAGTSRLLALASHHFIVTASFAAEVPIPEQPKQKHQYSLAALKDPDVANRFAALIDDALQHYTTASAAPSSLSLQYARITDAFHHAAEKVLPSRTARPQRPWISPATLKLLDDRSRARSSGDFKLEKSLHKMVRASVAKDRRNWLDGLLASGDWDQIKKLRKGFAPAQGRLKNTSGDLVESAERADTLATHLASVQWAARPTVDALGRMDIFHPLPIDLGPIREEEVCKAADTY